MLGAHTLRLTAPGLAAQGRAWLRAHIPPLSRLRKTAAAIASGAPIGPGERVLTSVRQVSTALVIATDRAVYHQDGPGGGHSWSRLGWEYVDQALSDDVLSPPPLTTPARRGSSTVVLRLPRHAPLVDFARERVTATTLARAPVLSGGRVCGWLTARRPPGSSPRCSTTTPGTGRSAQPARSPAHGGTPRGNGVADEIRHARPRDGAHGRAGHGHPMDPHQLGARVPHMLMRSLRCDRARSPTHPAPPGWTPRP